MESLFTIQERKDAKAMYLDNKGRNPRKHKEDRASTVKQILDVKVSHIKMEIKVSLLEPLN